MHPSIYKITNRNRPESEAELFSVPDELHRVNGLANLQHSVPFALEVVVGVDDSGRNPESLISRDQKSCQLKLGL